MPHATIFKPQQPYKRCIHETFKEFPASSLALLDTLLAIEPADRGSAAQALASEVNKVPSSLWNYYLVLILQLRTKLNIFNHLHFIN